MMRLTHNDHALLLLGSRIALPRDAEWSPFTVGQWNTLEEHLSSSPLREPAALIECSESNLMEVLEGDRDIVSRISSLRSRAGNLGIELEHLESRGVWVVTRFSDLYPRRFRERLGDHAPLVLFGAGTIPNSGPFVAVVGSREVDETAVTFCRTLARRVVEEGGCIVSGAARGVDREAMSAALEHGGQAVGILPQGLDCILRDPDLRQRILDDTLSLISPYAPSAPFSVGNAMGRNKLVYTLADYAVVISSGRETGGTWAGAVENLRHGWVPLFVWNGPNTPGGNLALIERGAFPLEYPVNGEQSNGRVIDYLDALRARDATRPASEQGVLFDD